MTNESLMTSHTGDFGRGLATWHTLSEGKPIIHFLHANGLPASSYRFLFSRLAQSYDISALENRGAWPQQLAPEKSINWSTYVDDFLAFADFNHQQDICVIGHSLGASISLLAALKQPERFKALVMIDPGTAPKRWHQFALKWLPDRFISEIRLVKSTMARKSEWLSREAFVDYIAKRETYKNFSEEALWDYANGGLCEYGGKFRLRFSPVWEAHNFKNIIHIPSLLAKTKVPILLLCGEHSNLFTPKIFASLCKKYNNVGSNITVKRIPGVGHLAPQEDPDETVKAIMVWLGDLSIRK